jgi:hypothetical protein
MVNKCKSWDFQDVPSFQIVDCFGFPRLIDVCNCLHINIHHIYVHTNIYAPREAKTAYNLEGNEYYLCSDLYGAH